jgi:hypothetical protein
MFKGNKGSGVWRLNELPDRECRCQAARGRLPGVTIGAGAGALAGRAIIKNRSIVAAHHSFLRKPVACCVLPTGLEGWPNDCSTRPPLKTIFEVSPRVAFGGWGSVGRISTDPLVLSKRQNLGVARDALSNASCFKCATLRHSKSSLE